MPYTENQRFKQTWMWVLLAVISVIPFFAYYDHYWASTPPDPAKAMSPLEMVIFSGLVYGVVAMIAVFRLRTHIDENGILARFVPLTRRVASRENIASVAVINYGFVGGWGIRIGTKYGLVLNISGNKGLLITEKSGKTWVLGTQQPEALHEWLVAHDYPLVDHPKSLFPVAQASA